MNMELLQYCTVLFNFYEINTLHLSQLEQLHGAKGRFTNARSVLDDISTAPEGRKVLVPLTSSLYVPGLVSMPEKVC